MTMGKRRTGRVLAPIKPQPPDQQSDDPKSPNTEERETEARPRGRMRRDSAADERPTYRGPDQKETYWSVTSLLGMAADPEPLIMWAHRAGAQGKSLYEAREAARHGTDAHKAVEAVVKGEKPDPTTLEGKNALNAFLRWRAGRNDLTIIATEFQVVCDKLKVGGTIDAIIRRGKQLLLVVGDWKTSRAIYPEHVAQVAAYAHMLEHGRANLEAQADAEWLGKPVTECLLVRLPKDGSDAEEHVIDKDMMEHGLKQFLAARDVVLSRFAIKGLLRAH